VLPSEDAPDRQRTKLGKLQRLLELDGFNCEALRTINGSIVPLLVKKGSRQRAVGIRPGLLGPEWTGHSLKAVKASVSTIILNDFILSRNLPDEHQMVRSEVIGTT
jgi:hypothetical protein